MLQGWSQRRRWLADMHHQRVFCTAASLKRSLLPVTETYEFWQALRVA